PTRLVCPDSSVKRYQYTVAGFRFPTSARQVQSAAAETVAGAEAITVAKASSSATSTSRRLEVPLSNGRRVQSNTLSGCGSPEATPSGNRSRRSFDAAGTERSRCALAGVAAAQTGAAPRAAAAINN